MTTRIRGTRQTVPPGTVLARVGNSPGPAIAVKINKLWASSAMAGSVRAAQVDNSTTFTIVASETLAAGDIVSLHTVAGVCNMRKANATDATKPAHGFVTSAVTSGSAGMFFGAAIIDDQRSGLTPGATYYLSTTGGAITTTPPSAAGNIVQEVGQAISATQLAFVTKTAVLL